MILNNYTIVEFSHSDSRRIKWEYSRPTVLESSHLSWMRVLIGMKQRSRCNEQAERQHPRENANERNIQRNIMREGLPRALLHRRGNVPYPQSKSSRHGYGFAVIIIGNNITSCVFDNRRSLHRYGYLFVFSRIWRAMTPHISISQKINKIYKIKIYY